MLTRIEAELSLCECSNRSVDSAILVMSGVVHQLFVVSNLSVFVVCCAAAKTLAVFRAKRFFGKAVADTSYGSLRNRKHTLTEFLPYSRLMLQPESLAGRAVSVVP